MFKANKDNPNNSTHRVIIKKGVYQPQYWYRNFFLRCLDNWKDMEETYYDIEGIRCCRVQKFTTKEEAVEYIRNKTNPKVPEETDIVFEVNVKETLKF